MDNIKFIRDDVEEKKIKQLQEVLNILSVKPKDIEIEAAKRFFYSMLKSAQEIAEKKKEEAEKEKMIKEIEQKKPPKPVEALKPSVMQKMLEEAELIPPVPSHTKPEIPDITEIPRPEDFKQPEPQPQTEEVIAEISKNYPLMIFKNIKGEALSQANMVQRNGKVIYELTEPEIDPRLVEETKKLVLKDFQKNRKIIKDEKYLADSIKKAFKKLKIDYTEEYKEEIKYFLYKDLLGLGRIDPLLHDLNVRTIMCDGLHKPVKIALGPGLEITTNITYTKKEELDDQIKHLGMKTGNQVTESNPIVEGMFYNFRIEATLGLGEAESKFTIKKLP